MLGALSVKDAGKGHVAANVTAGESARQPASTVLGATSGIPLFLQRAVVGGHHEPAQSRPFGPGDIAFDPSRPWVFTTPEGVSLAEVSILLYGIDLSELMQYEVVAPSSWQAGDATRSRFMLFPEALVPPYDAQFHSAAQQLLERHVAAIESTLDEGRIDGEDERRLVDHVQFWTEAKDIRQQSGRSYFDALLARLHQDRAAVDYVLWTGEARPYLDWLYDEVEERKGELLAIIAQNSLEFGAYEPSWMGLDVKGIPLAGGAPRSGANDIVDRAAQMILDALQDVTTGSDSRIIGDALSGLGPREQALVLRQVMSRYDESDWTGLFGRFGEAWEEGMLYYLFEDLSETDRNRVAASLRASGVLSGEAVDALVAGRGWGGKYLPYTTRKGQEAVEDWADTVVHSEGPKKWGAAFMGGLASLWLPETAGSTILALASAGAMNPQTGAFAILGQTFPRVATAVTVLGTGVGAFSATLAAQQAITGRNFWTGEKLREGEQLASALNAVAGAILVGVGFATTPSGLTVRDVFAPPRGGIAWRITSVNRETGDVTAVGKNLDTGETAVVQYNLRTGNGTGLNTSTGRTITIAGGRPQHVPALSAGDEAATGVANAGSAGAASAEETALALAQALSGPSLTGPLPKSMPGGLATASWMEPGVWYPLVPKAPIPLSTPAAPRPPLRLAAGEYPEGTLGHHLSRQSLDALGATYGIAIRNATANASRLSQVRVIAKSLGPGVESQYMGDLNEYLVRDIAPLRARFAAGSHGRSNRPGPDALEITLSGDPTIIVGESKASIGSSPYRVGASDLPNAFRQPKELFDHIHAVIRDKQLPLIVRIRLKAALDEGRIQWQLSTFGNVRVRISGNDRFPGDIVVLTPIVLPP